MGLTVHVVGFNVLSEQIKVVILFEPREQMIDVIKNIFDPLLCVFGVKV